MFIRSRGILHTSRSNPRARCILQQRRNLIARGYKTEPAYEVSRGLNGLALHKSRLKSYVPPPADGPMGMHHRDQETGRFDAVGHKYKDNTCERSIEQELSRPSDDMKISQTEADASALCPFDTESESSGNLPIRWPLSYPFLMQAKPKRAKELFDELNQGVDRPKEEVMMVFMDYFINMGKVDSALDVLNKMGPTIQPKSMQIWMSKCTRLLALEYLTNDGDVPNFYVAPRILESGVQPNSIMYTKIIQNAIKLGVSSVAWDMFDHINSNGLPVAPHALVMLLKLALQTANKERLESVLTVIGSEKGFWDNEYIFAYTLNVIRVLYGHQSRDTGQSALSKMFAFYSMKYDMEPLVKLGLADPGEYSDLPRKPLPDPDTLSYVAAAFILQCPHRRVRKLEKRIASSMSGALKSNVSDGALLAREMGTKRPVYDALITRCGSYPELLGNSLKTFESMLQRGTLPSERTIDMLVCAFESNGRLEALQSFVHAKHRLPESSGDVLCRLQMALVDRGFSRAHVMLEEQGSHALQQKHQYSEEQKKLSDPGELMILPAPQFSET